MKIALPEYNVESSADFESLAYGFGDPVILMEFLRNTLYSNPIATIVQEYMSNGRDAHRERGNPEQPLKITLPTKINPHFYCRDFGLGIDPNRMKTVFTQYGISTKRQENKETGGFGLGCKSGYSYADTFTIVTITEELDGRKVKRTYISILDESRMGAIKLVDERETDEETGTTIIIPVNPGDYHEFANQVKRTANWWNVKPEVINSNFEWDNYESVFEGKDGDWAILKSGLYQHGQPKAILDGIPYSLDIHSIYPSKDQDEDEDEEPPIPSYADDLFYRTNLRLFFDCGDLQVTLNRESIDYNHEGIQLLQQKIEKAYKEIIEHFEKALSEAQTLWEANIIWQSIDSKFRFLKNSAKWKGFKLFTTLKIPNDSRWHIPAKDRTSVYLYRRDSDTDDEHKPKMIRNTNSRYGGYESNSIPCSSHVLLVEDDTEYSTPPRTKLRTLFKENLNVDELYVVRIKTDTHRKTLEDNFHWSELNPIQLSKVEKTHYRPPTKVAPKAVEARLARTWSSWEPTDIDFNGSGIFVTKYKGKFIIDNKKWRASRDLSEQICLNEDLYDLIRKHLDKFKLYAILDRTVPKLGPGWISLHDHVESEIEKLKSNPAHADSLKYRLNQETKNFHHLNQFPFHKLSKDSILKQYFDLRKRVQKHRHLPRKINELEEAIGKPKTKFLKDDTLTELWKRIENKYPLFVTILESSFYTPDKMKTLKELAKYVHMVDNLSK